MDRAESLKGIKKDVADNVISNLPSVPETDLPVDDEMSVTSTPTNPSNLYYTLNYDKYIFK